MAAIDHTTIVFKNGKWMKDIYDVDEETGEWLIRLPFDFGRDGDIRIVRDPLGNVIDISEDMEVYHDEYDAIYERDGMRNVYAIAKNFYGIRAWLKYKLRFMRKLYYTKEVGVWTRGDVEYPNGDVEVYIYHDGPNQSYVSFYSDGADTYIVIGGYGHHKNVYCHFMDRGYGDEFEEKMAAEAFQWACGEILVEISESIYEYWDVQEDFVNEMRERFGYDDPYKIVDREAEE